MAGNTQIFQTAMAEGDSAAWDQQWNVAIEKYMAAVREFPTSTHACNSLGFALFQAGRLEDALRVYNQSARLDPNDPLPFEKSADVLERMGKVNEAAKQYLGVAEIYLAQHDLEKAIDSWERATKITPGMVGIHRKLAMAYERTGQKVEAINEYLKLAFNFQAAGKPDVAMQALQRALRLDAKEPRLLNAMTALRAEKQISPDLLEIPADGKAQEGGNGLFDLSFDPDIADSDSRGPMGDGVEHALERLATQVFEGGNIGLAEANAMEGIELQRAAIVDDAIQAYQKAITNGIKSKALYYNLGILLTEAERWQEAEKILTQIGGEDLLAIGARHALSLCFIGQKKWLDASNNLIQTLRLVELSMSFDEEERAELDSLYNRVASMLNQTDPQTLQNLSKRLSELLTGKDWKRRVEQTRSRMEDMLAAPDVQHAFEDLAQDEGVTASMELIDNFMSQKRFNLAMDEVQHVILHEPDYLAAHIKLGEILMELTHVEQAIQKYNFVARLYLLRGNAYKAAEILNDVIKIAPADISLRQNLIELLEQQSRWEDVMQQYIELAETYGDLADHSTAKMTYDQAMKLAQRVNAPQEKVIYILHKMGEIDLERIELRGAQRTFQRVLDLQAENVEARRQLAEIYYRLNNPSQGIQEVDQLLQVYARQRRPELILKTLEELSESYPSDMGLRARLGRVYLQMNKQDKALEVLEQLRQLQVSAGMHDEARQTIKQILTLNPAQADQYQRMLQQMGG